MKRVFIGLALAVIVSTSGCAYLKEVWDGIDWSTPAPAEPTPPGAVATPAPVKTPAPPQVHWRDGYDVATYPVSGNSFEFWTRNIQAPTRPNKPGDYEYILVRIQGNGLKRLLLMSMYARRPRIFIERTNHTYSIIDGRFSQPLPGPSKWRVAADGKRIWIELDGKEIWSEKGGYSVTSAIMAGYSRRGFLGEWSLSHNPSSAVQ